MEKEIVNQVQQAQRVPYRINPRRIMIAGRNINNLRYADDTTLMAEIEEPLDESERRERKSWLKAQHSEY